MCGNIYQSANQEVITRCCYYRTSIAVPYQNTRPVLLVNYSFYRSYITLKGGERRLGNADLLTFPGENFIDLLPSGAIYKCTINKHNVLDSWESWACNF